MPTVVVTLGGRTSEHSLFAAVGRIYLDRKGTGRRRPTAVALARHETAQALKEAYGAEDLTLAELLLCAYVGSRGAAPSAVNLDATAAKFGLSPAVLLQSRPHA